MPECIDDYNRKIRQLEIEKEVVKRDSEGSKLADINERLKTLDSEREVLMKNGKRERSAYRINLKKRPLRDISAVG